MLYAPDGVWMVAPEIILSGEKNEWSTVALAGTQPLQDGRLPQEKWGEKNRREQLWCLISVGSFCHRAFIPRRAVRIPAYAGALSHLKTSFRFTLKDNNRLGSLLELLHPTPAVCGLPKEERRFILDNEGYDRRYYSGFIQRVARP